MNHKNKSNSGNAVIDFRRLYSQTKQKLKKSDSNQQNGALSELESESESFPLSESSQTANGSPQLPAPQNPSSTRQTINTVHQLALKQGFNELDLTGRLTDLFPLPAALDWANIGSDRFKTLYYLPNYISDQEEVELMRSIYDYNGKSSWTELRGRRVLSFGGMPLPEGMEEEELPSWLTGLTDQLHHDAILPLSPNHVLINEYAPGQGIMPHKDGPLYFPRVAIISLGSGIVMNFRKSPGEGPKCSVYLEPRSLLIFQDDCFEHLFHGIDPVMEDDLSAATILWPEYVDSDSEEENPKLQPTRQVVTRDLRLSLTLRIVPNIVGTGDNCVKVV